VGVCPAVSALDAEGLGGPTEGTTEAEGLKLGLDIDLEYEILMDI